MLYTNLKHIESAGEFTKVVGENENVVIVCGGMESKCIRMYEIAEHLEKKFRHVKFFDMEFDNPEACVIRNLPEIKKLESKPYTLFLKKGLILKAIGDMQTRNLIASILNEFFGTCATA